jgi:hypothetical protein
MIAHDPLHGSGRAGFPHPALTLGGDAQATATLGRPLFHRYSFSILHHASVQPFLDEPHDTPVCNPVHDEPTSQSCEISSKKLLMSRSSTQFTLFPF